MCCRSARKKFLTVLTGGHLGAVKAIPDHIHANLSSPLGVLTYIKSKDLGDWKEDHSNYSMALRPLLFRWLICDSCNSLLGRRDQRLSDLLEGKLGNRMSWEKNQLKDLTMGISERFMKDIEEVLREFEDSEVKRIGQWIQENELLGDSADQDAELRWYVLEYQMGHIRRVLKHMRALDKGFQV